MTATPELTDSEINERLARALGTASDEPCLGDVALYGGGLWKCHRCGARGSAGGGAYHTRPTRDYLSGDGMLVLIEEMQERGWCGPHMSYEDESRWFGGRYASVSTSPPYWRVSFENDWHSADKRATALPRAGGNAMTQPHESLRERAEK